MASGGAGGFEEPTVEMRQVLITSRDRLNPHSSTTSDFNVDLSRITPEGGALLQAKLGDIDLPPAVDTVRSGAARLYADDGITIDAARRTVVATPAGGATTSVSLPLANNPVTAATTSGVAAGYDIRLTLQEDLGDPIQAMVGAWLAAGLDVRLAAPYGIDEIVLTAADDVAPVSGQPKQVDLKAPGIALQWALAGTTSMAIDPTPTDPWETRPFAVLHFQKPASTAQFLDLVEAALGGASTPLSPVSLSYREADDCVIFRHGGAASIVLSGTAAHHFSPVPADGGAITLTDTNTYFGTAYTWQHEMKPASRALSYLTAEAGSFATGAALAAAAQRALSPYWGTDDTADQALVLTVRASGGGPDVDLTLAAGPYTLAGFAAAVQAALAAEATTAPLSITVTADVTSHTLAFAATATGAAPWSLVFDAANNTVDPERLGYRATTYSGATSYAPDVAATHTPTLADGIPSFEARVTYDTASNRLRIDADPLPMIATAAGAVASGNPNYMWASFTLPRNHGYRDWDRLVISYSETKAPGDATAVAVKAVEALVLPPFGAQADNVVHVALVGATTSLDYGGAFGGIDFAKSVGITHAVPPVLNVYGNVRSHFGDSMPPETWGLRDGVNSLTGRLLMGGRSPDVLGDDDFVLLCLGFGGSEGSEAPWVGPMTYKNPGAPSEPTREVFARVVRRGANSSYIDPMAYVWPASGAIPMTRLRVQLLGPRLEKLDFHGQPITFVLNCVFARGNTMCM